MKKPSKRVAPKTGALSAADRKAANAKLALANGRLPELPAVLKYIGIAGRTAPLIVKASSLSKTHSDLLARRDAPPVSKLTAWGFALGNGKYLWLDDGRKR